MAQKVKVIDFHLTALGLHVFLSIAVSCLQHSLFLYIKLQVFKVTDLSYNFNDLLYWITTNKLHKEESGCPILFLFRGYIVFRDSWHFLFFVKPWQCLFTVLGEHTMA